MTVEGWLGVGLAGRADKQPGRRVKGREGGVGWEGGGRKRKTEGWMEMEADESDATT